MYESEFPDSSKRRVHVINSSKLMLKFVLYNLFCINLFCIKLIFKIEYKTQENACDNKIDF